MGAVVFGVVATNELSVEVLEAKKQVALAGQTAISEVVEIDRRLLTMLSKGG